MDWGLLASSVGFVALAMLLGGALIFALTALLDRGRESIVLALVLVALLGLFSSKLYQQRLTEKTTAEKPLNEATP
jgi:hypothetical protein